MLSIVGVNFTSAVHNSVQVIFKLILNVSVLSASKLLRILFSCLNSVAPDNSAILSLGHNKESEITGES